MSLLLAGPWTAQSRPRTPPIPISHPAVSELGNPPLPLQLPHASAQEPQKGCHTLKPALAHSLLTLTEVQPSPGRGDRSLPHFSSPGCTSVNPAPPPTPCNSWWGGCLDLPCHVQEWDSPSWSCSSAILSFKREWRSIIIFKRQRSNWVIALHAHLSTVCTNESQTARSIPLETLGYLLRQR